MSGEGRDGDARLTPEAAETPPQATAELRARGVSFESFFVSELLGRPVRFDGEGKPFGRLYDIGAAVPATIQYPLAVSLEVRARGSQPTVIPWRDVLELGPAQVVVRRPTAPAPASGFWLRRDVLDDQVVDVSGAKVVRVNDINVLHTEGELIVAHVAVGMRSILRRLGFERPVSAVVRWLLDVTIKDGFLSWRNVELIGPSTAPGLLRASGTPARLAEIHPAELADIIEQLGVRDRRTLLSELPLETVAGALEETEPKVQRAWLAGERPERAADILEEMSAQGAASVLRNMPKAEGQIIISRMEREAADDIKAILAHKQESAGGMMATACIEGRPGDTVGHTVERLRLAAHEAEVLYYVYVLNEARRLVGVVALRELLRAAPDLTLEDVMATELVTVSPDTHLERVARLFVRYGFRAIPVVGEANLFLGAVRLTSILEELAPFFKE